MKMDKLGDFVEANPQIKLLIVRNRLLDILLIHNMPGTSVNLINDLLAVE